MDKAHVLDSCKGLYDCFKGGPINFRVPISCCRFVKIVAWEVSYCLVSRCLGNFPATHLNMDLYSQRQREISDIPSGKKHGVPSSNSVLFGYNSFLLISETMKVREEILPRVYQNFGSKPKIVTLHGIGPGSLTSYNEYFSNHTVIIQNGDAPKPLVSSIFDLERHEDINILAYFTNNPAKVHHKVHAYPRAVSNLTKWESLFSDHSYCEKQVSLAQRKHLLMCKCLTLRKDGHRQSILSILTANGFKCITPKSCATSYHDALFDHRFIISPWGGGHSNHRDWEVLLAGAIPLIEFDPLLEHMFNGLPVVFVRDWKEITPRYLRKKWKKIVANSHIYDWKKMYAPYWFSTALSASYTSKEEKSKEEQISPMIPY